MIYATTDALTPEQWDEVVEDEDSARGSSAGIIVVKWEPPTPPELTGLVPMEHEEAVALMQTPDWRGDENG